MPTLTIEYQTEAERLILEPAIAYVTHAAKNRAHATHNVTRSNQTDPQAIGEPSANELR